MARNGRPCRVTALVVDDDPRCRSLVARTLRVRGLDVFEANDGYLGIGLLSRWSDRIGLLVVDTEMPGVHGWEVIRFARSRAPAMPVLRLGRVDDLVPGPAFEPFQSLPTLAKPFTAADLLAGLRWHTPCSVRHKSV